MYTLSDGESQADSQQPCGGRDGDVGRKQDHVRGGYDRRNGACCVQCAEAHKRLGLQFFAFLRANGNTAITSYRGTCVGMYAYCSLVTVSRSCYFSPKAFPNQLHRRGRRKEHNRHFPHQGIFRLPGWLQCTDTHTIRFLCH